MSRVAPTSSPTSNHKASSGLRYIVNPPGSAARVHPHLDIGQGEVPWDDFFGAPAEVAWEERAEQSSRFMRDEMQRRIDKHWGTK